MGEKQTLRDLADEIRVAEAKLVELRRQQRIQTTQESATMIAQEAYTIMEKEAERCQIPFSVVLATMNKLVLESERLYERNGVDY